MLLAVCTWLGVAIFVIGLVWAVDVLCDWLAWKIVFWRHKDLVKENTELMAEVNAIIERIKKLEGR